MDAGKMTNCPQCGNPVAQTDQFCPKCFARLEPPGLWRKILSLFQSAAKSGPRVVNIKKTVTIKMTGADGQTQEYHSLDEAPPEMRAEIEKLEAEVMKERGQAVSLTEKSQTGDKITSRTIIKKNVSVFTIKDASGNERVYHSLDELPPEIREAVKRAQNKLD